MSTFIFSIFFLLSSASDAFAQPLSTFIFGGQEVAATQSIAQSTVALFEGQEFQCSAVLISSEHALTAAHCLRMGARYQIRFGTKMRSNTPTREVSNYVIHSKFNPRYNTMNPYDLALLNFSGGLPSNYKAANIQLSKWDPWRGDRVMVGGFGIHSRYEDVGYGTLRQTELRISDTMFNHTEVTMEQSGNDGVCFGDSGGPAWQVDSDGFTIVVGVASRVNSGVFADNQIGCGNFVTYSRIDAFKKWIEENITLFAE